MPAAYGQRLKLRLFLEGVEVPVVSANVQSAPNSPTVASIQVPPLPEGTRLYPRTLVHLFFLDDYELKVPYLNYTNRRSTEETKDPTQYQKDDEREQSLIEGLASQGSSASGDVALGATMSQYKLLFGGELMGFVWNKTASSRALVLQCLDWSNYWDYAYQCDNTSIFGPTRKMLFTGSGTSLFNDFLESEGMAVARIVRSGKCNSYPNLKGLAAGIVRLIEAIGGVYYPNPRAKGIDRRAGQNIFFSLAELRLHITNMIAATEADDTSAKLINRPGFFGLFNRALGALGGQTSIRKAMNAISSVIFHETYGQPCPYYKPGFEGAVSGRRKTKLSASEQFKYLFNGALYIITILSTISDSLDNASEDTVASAGGLEAYDSFILASLDDAKEKIQQLLTQSNTKKAPAAASTILSQTLGTIGSITTALNDWRPEAPSNLRSGPTDKMQQAIKQLNRLTELTIDDTPKNMVEPARLNQHIFRPDIWFGSPPRCNVIFPENYDSLSYQRMFLQEPTRLLLKTNDEFFGEDFLFDKLYFAPQTGSLKKDQATLQSMLRNDLLEHELFTGILPVFEKSGEFNIFASMGKTTYRKNTNDPHKLVNEGVTKYSDTKEGYAQRSANFLYFKYRFNSRQMRIAGKFNPYVAPGFPGLIIDSYKDAATLYLYNDLKKKADIPQQKVSELLGTNFLGNFTTVSHMVSQQDARSRTEIGCSYPRQPEETVEFLRPKGIESESLVQEGEDAKRTTVVAALEPPKLSSIGPNGGRIINVVELVGTPTTLPLFSNSPYKQGKLSNVSVPTGKEVTGRELGSKEVTAIVGDPDQPIIFRAFQLDELVPRYRRVTTTPAMESLIHPGWYSDIWKPANIGKAYQTFIATGSITDPQTVINYIPPERKLMANDFEKDAKDHNQSHIWSSADGDSGGAPVVTAIGEKSTILDAVEFLVLTYSYIKQNNLDVDQFIKSYTWRPIASMIDLFGTSDLAFSADGEAVISGIEGFHSRAFGPYDDLFGLVSPDIETLLGIKRESRMAQKGDTRKRKQEAVQQYVAALKFSRGILG